MKYGKFRVLFVLEIIAILFTMVIIILPNKTYSFDPGNLQNTQIWLSHGKYVAEVSYLQDTENLMLGIEAHSDKWWQGNILTNTQLFNMQYTLNKTEFWVTGLGTYVSLNTGFFDNTAQYMKSITVKQTNHLYICFLMVELIVFALTLISFEVKNEKIKITKQNKVSIAVICFVSIIASLPVFTNYIPLGFDSIFHIVRIQGMKEALLSGQFPVRVEPTYLGGYGYAVSMFYGGIFFYPAAVLMLLGFTLQFSFKFMIVMINAIMAIGSYKLFKEITKKEEWGYIGCIIFTLSAYKFYNTYYRGALGEQIAMAIVPYFALAMWNVFTKPYDDKYKYRWIPLAISFSFILESHLISTEIVGVTAMLICLINYKRTFSKNTFVLLVKFVIVVFIINLYFLVPFIYGLCSFDMVVNQWNTINKIQNTGISFKDMFAFRLPDGKYNIWYEQEYIIGAGLAFGVSFLVYIYSLVFLIKNPEMKKEKALVKSEIFFGSMALIYIVLCSNVFPWDKILDFLEYHMGKLGNAGIKMIVNMQYVYRIMPVAAIFVVGMAVVSLMVISRKSSCMSRVIAGIIVTLSVSQVIILEGSITNTEKNSKQKITYINEADYALNMNVGNNEYLPVMEDGSWMSVNFINCKGCETQNAEVMNLKKSGSVMTASIQTDSENIGIVEFPIIYYPGYSIYDIDKNTKIPTYRSGSGRVMCIIDANQTVNIKLEYNGLWWWKIADIISLISLGAVIYIYIRKLYHY